MKFPACGRQANYKFQISNKISNNKFQNYNINAMPKQSNTKPYDLEERTFQFAKDVTFFCKKLPINPSNVEYSKQVIRSSGSVGSNYIEANESLGKKDFVMKVKICRKEAKESAYWLRLLRTTNPDGFDLEAESLFNEAIELKKIFSSIVEKSK